MMSLIFTSMFIAIIISATNFLINLEDVAKTALTGGYDYLVVNKDDSPITKEQEDAVLNTNITKVSEFDDFGYIKVKDKDYLMYIYGTDTNISYKVGILSQENNQGYTLKENEIVVLEDELKDLNLKIGDKITFYNSKGNPYELTIAKTIKNDLDLSYTKEEFYTFGTSLETFKKITESEKLENYSYYISFNEKLDEDAREKFENKCEEIGLKLVEPPDSLNIMGMLGIIIPILIIAIMLLAVIVYFVNSSFVKIILNERVPVMGTFRSVGATSKKVDRILILEMTMYGLISGIIGSILGFVIFRAIIKYLFIPFMSDQIIGYNFDFVLKAIDNSVFSILIISILSVTIFQILISLKDIFASGKKSIKDCIFSKYDDIQIIQVKNLIIGITFLIIGIIAIVLKNKLNVLWGVLGIVSLFVSISKLLPFIFNFVFSKIKFKNPVYKIACSNISNSKLQISNSVILCVLLSIIIILISFANSEKRENLDLNDKYSFDSYIDITSATEEDVNDILFLDGIKSAILYVGNFMGVDETYLANNKLSTFFILATDNAETLINVNKEYKGIDKEMLSNLTKNEIIISREDAQKYDIEIGDYIYLTNVLKKEHFDVELPVYLKVVGFQDYSSKMAFISMDLMNELTNIGLVSAYEELYLLAEDNVDITKNINKLLEERQISDRALTLDEYLQSLEDETASFYTIIIIVCILLALIVLICLINNQKISFLQRKKELATLNSICMSRKQLKKMITAEIMLAFVISSLIAFIYAILFTIIVSQIIDIKLVITFKSIIIIFIIMAIVMYWVSRKIRKNVNKINIIDEIKYE